MHYPNRFQHGRLRRLTRADLVRWRARELRRDLRGLTPRLDYGMNRADLERAFTPLRIVASFKEIAERLFR